MKNVDLKDSCDDSADSISSELLINVIRTLTTTVSNDQRQLEKQRIEHGYKQSEQNIDKLLKEHRSDALHCLNTFQSVSKELTSCREQIRNIKSSLSLCKSFLQCRRDDLNKFWLENVQQKKVCDILQQIQQIKETEKNIDVQLASGEYKEVIRVLKDADVLLKGPFEKLDGISQLKFVVSENLQKVFCQIVTDLLQCTFVEPFEIQTLESVKSGKLTESKIGAVLIERYPKKKLVALNDENSLRLRLADLLRSLLLFGRVDKALDEMFQRMPNLFLRLSNEAAEVVKQSAGGERAAVDRDATHLAKFANIAIAQMSFASRNFALLSLELQQLNHQFPKNIQPILKRYWRIIQSEFEEILAEHLLVWRNKKHRDDGTDGGAQKKALFSFENASFVSSVNASSRKKQICIVCAPSIYNIVAIFHKLSALCREIESQLGEDCCSLSAYLQTFVAEAFLEQIRVDLEKQTESVLNGPDIWSSMSDVPPHVQRVLSCCVRVFELCERINGYIVSMEPYALRFASFWLLILEHFIKGFSDKYFQIVMLRQVHSDGGWTDYPKLSAAWVVDEDISRLLMSLPSWSAVKKSPFSPDQAQTPFAADVVNLSSILGESEQEIRERTQRESEILIGNLGTQKKPKSSELITSMEHIKALACLHESLQWFVGKMCAVMDGLSSRAKELIKTRIQITTSGNDGSPFIDQMLSDAITDRINSLEKLSDNLLLILHLELRFHCFFHLITITQNQSAHSLLSQDEIDRDVMEFGRDLSQLHGTLHAHLSPTKLKYLFDGLGYLCSSIFIHSCQYLTKLSDMGRKRICRAIFSVQKYLSQMSGRPETELQRAQIFFDFLNKDLDQLFATIIERGAVFSFIEYSILLSLLIRSHPTLNSQPGVLEAATNQLRDILSQQKEKQNMKQA
ncbi:hypothetical protein niasHT_000195 [Heterodera trifolii]|uniref:Exocyst complex component Sec8 n=1 Tax=Heterodera trifolii TaxID=157864 RepID=A0ABD2LVK1_9BILA